MSRVDLVGQVMGNYRIESLLGSGGMGQVYKGVHVLLNRPAAVKVMHAHLAADASFQARFLQEAKVAASLNHPNIVQIYDFGQKDDQLFLVMELIADGSLRSLLQQRAGQPLNRRLALRLTREAADALFYSHRRGMVHRDIKPDNLLIQRQANQPEERSYLVKVTDFGLARLAEGGVATAVGVTMGTPAYMSPEQAQGDELDGRSDIYSLGVVLFEAVTGSLPFVAKTLSEAVHQHVYTPPPSPRQLRADLPADVEAIILRCLAKQPNDRFASAAELSGALAAALGEAAPAAPLGRLDGTQRGQLGSPPVGGTILNQATPGAVPPVVPTILGGGPSPRIHVVDQSGKTLRTLDLTRNGLTVGRMPDNDVALPANDVSRNHLRIDWDGNRVSVTDLGSSNGTVVGDSRLLPQVPQTWAPGEWLRVGPFWMRLQGAQDPDTKPMPPVGGGIGAVGGPPVIVGSAAVAAPPAVESSQLHLALDQEQLTLTPGQPQMLRATVANLGSQVDHLTVSVDGVPSQWIKAATKGVQLNPGTQGQVAMSVLAPREPASLAGDYPVSVMVSSTKNPGEKRTVRTAWTVLPYTGSSLALEPARRSAATRAKFGVNLTNDGNAPSTYSLSGKDDEEILGYRFQQPAVTLQPGTAGRVGLTVEAPRRWVGTSQRKPFSVQATSDAGGPAQTAPGELVHRALIPVWVPPLALALLLALAFLLKGLLFPAPKTPAIESITVDPLNPVAGQPFTVHWRVRDASSVDIRPLVAGLDPTVGAYIVQTGIPSNVQLTLVANNDNGSSEKPVPLAVVPPTPSPTPEPGAPVIQTWTISPMAVQLGQPVTISWNVENADSVEIEPFGTVDLQGQRQDLPQATTRYTLTAKNKDKTVRRSEQVIVIMPTPTPLPNTAQSGGSGGAGGAGGTGGGGGAGGMMTPTPVVTPTPAVPTLNVSASKTEIDPFECITLSWDIQNAKSVTLDGTDIPLKGTKEDVCPGMTKTYRWVATGMDNKTTERTLTVGARPWKIEHFVGDWVNVDPNTQGLTHIKIDKRDNLSVIFHAFGKCSPTDCDWDAMSSVRPDNVPFTAPKLVGSYFFGFKTSKITVERFGDELQVTIVDTPFGYNPTKTSSADNTTVYHMRLKGTVVDPGRIRIRLTPFVRE